MPDTPNGAATVERLQRTIRDALDAHDRAIHSERLRTMILELVLIAALGVVAVFSFFFRNPQQPLSILLPISSIVAALAAALLFGFRSPLRLARQVATRDELSRKLRQLDLVAHAAEPDAEEQVRRFAEDVDRLCAAQAGFDWVARTVPTNGATNGTAGKPS